MIVEFWKNGELQRGWNFRMMSEKEYKEAQSGMQSFISEIMVDGDVPIKSIELSFGEDGKISDLNNLMDGKVNSDKLKQRINLR